MTASDAQIEIAILASIERQANRTAAALQRVVDLLGAVEEKKGLNHANAENNLRNRRDAAVVATLRRIADALDEIAGTLAAIYQDSKKADAQDD